METFNYSTETPEIKEDVYLPTKPHILKLVIENEDGTKEEKLFDNSRYPGHVLREIRKTHR